MKLKDILDELREKNGIITFKVGDSQYHLSGLAPCLVADKQMLVLFAKQRGFNLMQACTFYKYYTDFMLDYLDYTIVIKVKDTCLCGLYQIEDIQIDDYHDGGYVFHDWNFILKKVSR